MDNREKYEGVGFPTRLARMFRGLGRPRGTAAYKLARLELQRLSAPVSAAVFVAALFAAVVVLTMATEGGRPEAVIVRAAAEPEAEPPEEAPPDPPEEPVDPTVDVTELFAGASPVPCDCAAPEDPLPPQPGMAQNPLGLARTPSPVALAAAAGALANGFGSGIGGDAGFGTVIGPSGGPDVTGCLIGRIVDFKTQADGTPRAAYSAEGTYWRDAKSLVDRNFDASAFAAFFVPDKRVALTHLWIPPQTSRNGPKAFGAADVMQPSGFAVYYTGTLKAAAAGRYRLWGYFDDFMLVRIDGKTVLDAEWNTGGLVPGRMTGWKTSDPKAVGRVKCPQGGGKMAPGDWFSVDPGRPRALELFVGERPGGMVGGVLLIEQEGVDYVQAADGTTVLPVFAVRPLAETVKLDLAEAAYPMSVDSPRFNAKPRNVAAATQGDVVVDVNI